MSERKKPCGNDCDCDRFIGYVECTCGLKSSSFKELNSHHCTHREPRPDNCCGLCPPNSFGFSCTCDTDPNCPIPPEATNE